MATPILKRGTGHGYGAPEDSKPQKRVSGLNFTYGFASSSHNGSHSAIGSGMDRWASNNSASDHPYLERAKGLDAHQAVEDIDKSSLNYVPVAANRGNGPTSFSMSSSTTDLSNNPTASKQRLIVASQALEIQQLQDTVRRLEKEARERTANHSRQIDVLEERLHQSQHRNRQLEGDVQIIGGKLRSVETRLDVQSVNEVGASSSSQNEEQLNRYKNEITKLRLECRTFEEEKGVLLQKLLDERTGSHDTRARAEFVASENSDLRGRIAELTSTLEETMSGKKSFAAQSAAILSGDSPVAPISTSTQTTTDTVVPLAAFKSYQAAVVANTKDQQQQLTDNTEIGADAYATQRTVTGDMKYLLAIEKGRVAFYSGLISEHTKNIEHLNVALKVHMQSQLSKLNSQQSALKRMMEEMEVEVESGEEPYNNTESNIRRSQSTYSSTPAAKRSSVSNTTTRLRSPSTKSIHIDVEEDIDGIVFPEGGSSRQRPQRSTESHSQRQPSTFSPPKNTRSSYTSASNASHTLKAGGGGGVGKYGNYEAHEAEMAALKSRLDTLQTEHTASVLGHGGRKSAARGQTPIRTAASHHQAAADRDYFSQMAGTTDPYSGPTIYPSNPLLQDYVGGSQGEDWNGGGSQPGSILRKMLGGNGSHERREFML